MAWPEPPEIAAGVWLSTVDPEGQSRMTNAHLSRAHAARGRIATSSPPGRTADRIAENGYGTLEADEAVGGSAGGEGGPSGSETTVGAVGTGDIPGPPNYIGGGGRGRETHHKRT